MAVIRATRPNFVMFMIKLAFSDTILTCPPSKEVGIEGWNQSEDSCGFVYSKFDKKGLKCTILVKCLVMGVFLVIDAMSSKYPNKEPLSLQINVNDYDGGDGRTNFANQFRNFDELVKKLNSELLSKLDDTPKPTGSSSPPSLVAHPIAPRGIFIDHPELGPWHPVAPRGICIDHPELGPW
ncbi:hypothetical protein MKW94_019784 [Papaver nudicaule]|uniref:PI31 proteasome regulator N-terminal domain-containing protein n=1 Tax=Papaver nudicaule TaxID=74823 RepID=A0AA41VDN6_PAPNU|nr:hypothetical protein [Papaver nudicaule]